MKKVLVVVLLLGFVSGCATAPVLTEKGQQVRLVNGDPRSCRYIGEVAAYTQAFSGTLDLLDAKGKALQMSEVDVRNQAGEQGGNAVVKIFNASAASLVFDIYAVYRCPS